MFAEGLGVFLLCSSECDRVHRSVPDLQRWAAQKKSERRTFTTILQDPGDDDEDEAALLHRHGCAGSFWIRMGLLREPLGLGGMGRPVSLHLHRAGGVNGSVCAAAAARPAGKRLDHSGGVATPTNEKHHLPVPEQHGPIRRADSAADASGSL